MNNTCQYVDVAENKYVTAALVHINVPTHMKIN